MLIAQHFTPLLCAASPDAAFTGNATLYIVATVVPVLGLALTVTALFLNSRRNPPVAEEMHKVFIPRAEHDEHIQRVHERIDKCAEDNIAARNQFSKAFGDLEHAIGRLEGLIDRDERSRKV